MTQGGRTLLRNTLVFTGFFSFSELAAAQDFDTVQITATPVAGKVQLLQGQGGNIAASIGEDGVLMVDDQFAPLADKIKATLAELGGGDPSFVVNTHWHGDHTGGNERFADHATIIAQENLRKRLADPAAGSVPAALPMLTYTEHMSLHFNGEEVRLIHLPAGHTDGDSAVWFTGSNVIHLGDEYTNRNFPFIDIGSGGTLTGLVRNAEQMLQLLPDDIIIVPGHGPLSTKADYALWVDGVKATAEIVMGKMAAGEDLQTIIDEGLPDAYASWGRGFINETAWITAIYNSTAAQN